MNIDFKKQYMDWLNSNIFQNKISENIYSIVFPYLDHNNDHIEIYIIMRPDNTFLLSDDGETINELELSGMNIFSSDKRKGLLDITLNSHGVHLGKNNSLCIECDETNLPVKKHMLTQCIIKISDMFQLSRPNIQSLF